MIDLNDTAPPLAPAVHYDLDVIVARLRERAGSWVPQHFPNGRREGDEWRFANINGAPPRKNGSCVIALKGERAGDWHEFDGDQGGGPLSALEAATGLRDRALFAHAADLVGWSPDAPARREPPASPIKVEKDSRQEIAYILSRTVPIGGTPGETYLHARGLACPASPDLLFHPDLVHWDSRTGYPALVGVVRDRVGAVVAVHRTYLSPGGAAKADVAKPRKMLGRVAGGAVRLAPIGDDGVVALSEGIETALAVMTACPAMPAWATMSANNLEQVQLPPQARHVILLADNDASGAGLRAAEAAARRLGAEGRRVALALPPQAGDDFNDVLQRDGADAVRRIVEAAEMRPATAPPINADTRNRPIGFAEPAGRLPQLRADEGNLARAHGRAWALLLESNRTPWLFRSAGLPTWVVHDDDGLPMARQITEERLRHMLAKLADWRRPSGKDELVPAHPPMPLVKSLLATPDPGLPVLAGIVTAPVFGRNGALLTEPGYHPDARLLYQPTPGFTMPPVPQRPAADDIGSARALLIDDLLGDFPFTTLAERAHAVSILLLGFLRAMIDGPTPLHLIEKPTPGTGATLMVDALATVLTGAGAAVMTEGRDDEEWRKRVTAKLRQIPSLVLIDNLRHQLDSSALAAALTAPFWEDRILGASEMTRLPIRCIWIATGNNPEFSNEMARRLVRIRLDARVDQPWRREGFRHPDLMSWVRANRGRLVAACLTLCRAWIAAGRPRGTRSIGSYESWAQTLGGVLEVAGIEGFLTNLDEMMRASDGEGAIWRSFVAAWWDRFGTAEVGTSDVYQLALNAEPPMPLGSGNDHAQRTRLGRALGKMRGRIFRVHHMSLRIEVCGTYQNAQRWQLGIDDEMGADGRSRRSPDPPDLVNVVNVGERADPNVHEKTSNDVCGLHDARERRERCERVPNTNACARTQAPVKEDPEIGSPRSRRSPDPDKSTTSDGERGGERSPARSPVDDPPDWLKEVL
ncbi:MAG: toprim domain-containing protein [Reyranellaceae bacterium]